jgi:hypothetical protein
MARLGLQRLLVAIMDGNSGCHWDQVYSANEELGSRTGKQPEGWRQQTVPKRWCACTRLHGVKSEGRRSTARENTAECPDVKFLTAVKCQLHKKDRKEVTSICCPTQVSGFLTDDICEFPHLLT